MEPSFKPIEEIELPKGVETPPQTNIPNPIKIVEKERELVTPPEWNIEPPLEINRGQNGI